MRLPRHPGTPARPTPECQLVGIELVGVWAALCVAPSSRSRFTARPTPAVPLADLSIDMACGFRRVGSELLAMSAVGAGDSFTAAA